MKNYIFCAAAGLLALSAYGQNTAFQVFTSSDAVAGPGTVRILSDEGPFGKTVTGKPFSGVEERHTLQILGDGTRIETKTSDKIFRDDQGRTRIERQNGTVLITDPVQGASAEIAANGHVSRRGAFSYKLTTGNGPALSLPEADAKKLKMKAELSAAAGQLIEKDMATASAEVNKKLAMQGEDLGYQSVNGVTAKGVRNTNTIEAGKIGNDRPMIVVSERWFSSDLDMLVKSTNKDPRFGETSYELTNILQVAPDPALFQIPAASSNHE